jgi:hypothetical protein
MYTPSIETDIPLADYPPTFEDLQGRVNAAFAALDALAVEDVAVTDEDEQTARDILAGMDKRLTKGTEVLLSSPGVVLQVKAILSEYDKKVVESAAQIRTFVTNKLIMETTNPNPSIRMKALELLGKISDVGLFTEKTEITMRHRPTEELEQMLRERLLKTIDAEPEHNPRSVPAVDLRMDILGGSDAA